MAIKAPHARPQPVDAGPSSDVPHTTSKTMHNQSRIEQTASNYAPSHGSSSDAVGMASVKEDDNDSCDPKDEKKEGGMGSYFRIFKYTDTIDRMLYAMGLLCAIAGGVALPLMTVVFGSSTSIINQQATSQADATEFQSRIHTLVLYLIYIFLGRFVVGYVGTLAVCIAATRTTNTVRKAFFEKLIRQDISHFDLQGNGSVASQVTTSGNRIYQGIAEKLFTCVVGLSLFFASYVVALVVQWKLALISMSIVPGMFITVGGCIGAMTPIETKIAQLYSQAGNIAQDAFGSMKTVHAFGAQNKIVEAYDVYLKEAFKVGKRKSFIFGFLFSSQNFFTISGTALAFWEGYRLYRSGEVPNVGTVITVFLSVTLGATSVLLFVPQIESITNASSAADELFSIIDKPSKLDPLTVAGEKPTHCAGEIEIRNLVFAYPSRPKAPVLRDVSLKIPAGKTTALVGPSGCGKSTIVGLLERWYKPTSGKILLDGREISEYNISWLRSNIRLVQQEPTLFQGTVAENVAKGFVGRQKNMPKDEQMKCIEQACQAADAHAFIQQLPQGYQTQLGEGARMLSGGQRQRIAIARSIISEPRVLLCDEATSALDPRAEGVVQKAINKASEGKTTLIIAHKLATVMAADNIVVMANGQIVEQGSHHELLQLEGLYAAMVRAQDLGVEAGEDQSVPNPDQATKEVVSDDQLSDCLQPQSNDDAKKDAVQDREEEKYTAGTLHTSLLKCVWIMLREHNDLYIWYLLTTIGTLLVGGTYAIQAVLFSHLIGVFNLQGPEGQSRANFFALMLFILALANLLGFFVIGICCNKIGGTLTYRYRKEMLQRMLHMDQDFFDFPGNSSGSLTAKLSSVPTAAQELMSQNLGLILNVLTNIISSSILGIAYGWKLGLTLVFVGLVLIVGSGYVRIRLDQKLETSTDKQYSTSAGLAAETVSSIRTVSSLALEEDILRAYGTCLDEIVKDVIRSLLVTLVPYSFSQSADFLVLALGFWYGTQLLASGEYTTSQFFVVFLSVVFGDQAAAQFFTYTTSITKAKNGTNYILWLRTVPITIEETPNNRDQAPSEKELSMSMKGVEFAYRQRQEHKVLRGMTLDIPPGTFAAFVGPSGCGKSTVISLIQRFYDPTSGQLTMSGEDISRFSPALYRQCMSLVQQEPPLYVGSVRDNITFGLTAMPSDEEVQQACRQANALDFVTSLPEGLNTPVGSRGTQLSGGQRQRIAVARALIRKPRLLLLDEATSALDTQSEKIVQKALDEAMSGRTTIAVAHRLSTIRDANIIFVMEDGRIVESGTHAELQQLRGRYHAMCLTQSLDQA